MHSLPCFWNQEPCISVPVASKLLCEAGRIYSVLGPIFSFSKLNYTTYQAHPGVVEDQRDDVRTMPKA